MQVVKLFHIEFFACFKFSVSAVYVAVTECGSKPGVASQQVFLTAASCQKFKIYKMFALLAG